MRQNSGIALMVALSILLGGSSAPSQQFQTASGQKPCNLCRSFNEGTQEFARGLFSRSTAERSSRR